MDKVLLLPHHYLWFTLISSFILYGFLGLNLYTIAWLGAGLIVSILDFVEDQLLRLED